MLILDPATDPVFNLAADEFLLCEVSEPVLRIWRSSPCVVIGRHQIPCVEADVALAARLGVPVLRRLSGGGAVYHDMGNVNFTIVGNLPKGLGIDFARMLQPIAAALGEMGVAAQYAGRGDLRVSGRKISGNSAYLWKGRVLHHGTLLFDADLDTLESLLEVRGGNVSGKSIRSVKSAVTNLRPLLTAYGNAWDFATAFARKLAPLLNIDPASAREFSTAEKSRITEIVRARYVAPEWNLGASPDYTIERRDSEGRAIRIAARNGRVNTVELDGDDRLSGELCKALADAWHDPCAFESILARVRAEFPSCPPVEAFF
jgi:lipoate---protein ligase